MAAVTNLKKAEKNLNFVERNRQVNDELKIPGEQLIGLFPLQLYS
jgi:hypothetical protein